MGSPWTSCQQTQMSSHLVNSRGRGLHQAQQHEEAGKTAGSQGGHQEAGAQVQGVGDHHAHNSRAVGGAAGALMEAGKQAEEAEVSIVQGVGAEGGPVAQLGPHQAALAHPRQHQAAEAQAGGQPGLEGSQVGKCMHRIHTTA
jgi:hypothetical protein